MKKIPGINIQWPWAELILSGTKTVETRSYRLPRKYVNVELAVIQTPGPLGREKAKIVGTIIFSGSFQYKDRKDWLFDHTRHRVTQSDEQFGFHATKPKWGWIVKTVTKLPNPAPAPKRKGIVFTTNCQLPITR